MCYVTIVCCYNNERMYADFQDTLRYVVYSHQDIILTEPDNLEKFVS